MKYLKNEDDAQDAVMGIFEKLPGDLRKHQIENFKGWLHSVVKNHCLMYLRRRQSQLKKEKEYKKDYPVIMESGYGLHQDRDYSKEMMLVQLEECIKKLQEKQRIAVELFYLQEKCYQEVSAATGFSMNDVKSYIQNGKRNLTICMSEKNERVIA